MKSMLSVITREGGTSLDKTDKNILGVNIELKPHAHIIMKKAEDWDSNW